MIKTVIHTTITYMITSLLCVYSNQHVHFFQKYSFNNYCKTHKLDKKTAKIVLCKQLVFTMQLLIETKHE